MVLAFALAAGIGTADSIASSAKSKPDINEEEKKRHYVQRYFVGFDTRWVYQKLASRAGHQIPGFEKDVALAKTVECIQKTIDSALDIY